MAKGILVFEDLPNNKTNVKLMMEPSIDSIAEATPAQQQAYNVCMKVREAMEANDVFLDMKVIDGRHVN